MTPKITEETIFFLKTEDGIFTKDHGGPWFVIVFFGLDHIFDNHEFQVEEEKNKELEELFIKYKKS